MNEPSCRDAPINLGPVARIPLGEGRTFELGELRVAVFRTRDGRLFATQAECPHRGGPLADGIVGGGTLLCPLHACRFALGTGEALAPGCGGLRTFRIEASPRGELLLRVGEQ